jgi:hypothetical protein
MTLSSSRSTLVKHFNHVADPQGSQQIEVGESFE